MILLMLFYAFFNHGHSYDVLSALHGIDMSMQILKEGSLVIVRVLHLLVHIPLDKWVLKSNYALDFY